MNEPRIGGCGNCGRQGLLVTREVWPDGPDDGMVVWVCNDCTDREDDDENG